MSWSVSAVGKAQAVKAKIVHDIEQAQAHMPEPERSVAESAKRLICDAMDAQVPDNAVKVTAFGSQSKWGQRDGPETVTNSVKLEIEPISGFVE